MLFPFLYTKIKAVKFTENEVDGKHIVVTTEAEKETGVFVEKLAIIFKLKLSELTPKIKKEIEKLIGRDVAVSLFLCDYMKKEINEIEDHSGNTITEYKLTFELTLENPFHLYDRFVRKE